MTKKTNASMEENMKDEKGMKDEKEKKNKGGMHKMMPQGEIKKNSTSAVRRMIMSAGKGKKC